MKFYVIGDVTVDHLHFLDRIPAGGEEVTPQRSTLLPGGAGGTIAYYLARLGHKVTLAARVGADPFREVALRFLREEGVDLAAVQEDKEALTSTITIMVTPDAERAMISSGGANRNLDAAQLKKKDIEGADGLVVSAYSMIGGLQREFAIKAVAAAKKAEVPVFIDLGTGAVNAAGTKLLEVVKGADYLLMNQLELQRITGREGISEALEGLHEHGVNSVVVKVGALGSIVWTPTETELLEGYDVDGVVDSTGAGDAFTAAFAHAVLSGFDMRQSARYANVAGALVATAVGAQAMPLSHQDLVTRMRA
ncbi:MAG TPA: carbohydrate kinase family protein [Deinococcales bacterium]|nr:carbohydrate kinase family protein [Deinococcales bacterium]